jgi:hypothetical protein
MKKILLLALLISMGYAAEWHHPATINVGMNTSRVLSLPILRVGSGPTVFGNRTLASFQDVEQLQWAINWDNHIGN